MNTVSLQLSSTGLHIAHAGFSQAIAASVLVSLAFTTALLVKSLLNFSRTGPQLKAEILRHYWWYSLRSLLREALWAFLLCSAMSMAGIIVGVCSALSLGVTFPFVAMLAAGCSAIAFIAFLQFCRHLLYIPASLVVSLHYLPSRLYPLWRHLSPRRLAAVQAGTVTLICVAVAGGVWRLSAAGSLLLAAGLLAVLAGYALVVRWAAGKQEPTSRNHGGDRTEISPNIIMIGSDTLRADRLGLAGGRRNLTPFLDRLAARGTYFTQCYVPCARTAPSLISLLTGTWPHRHGVRGNFVGDEQTELDVLALPQILGRHGYRSAAVSDWCGGDLDKFSFGFDWRDLPSDQWNIKYLIRQGPKDLRLFLSLFTHSRFGKRFLPELYYLAGVPLTSEVGRDARAMINRLSEDEHPFFLNIFMSTTHPPFGTEYPYYTRFSDPDYQGESKFAMARLTDPFEIIRRQGDSKTEFDLEQIIDLYDASVKRFDDEVARIVTHVQKRGLEKNTILVIYSDHGMEFFEHDTWGQGNSVVGDFSAKVPLIIVDPRRQPMGKVDRTIRTVDVAPTLLGLAGVKHQYGMDGESLISLLDGKDDTPDLPAFAETGIWLTELPGMPEGHLGYPPLNDLLEVPNKGSGTLAIKSEYQSVVVSAKDRMIRAGQWKLVYQPLQIGVLYLLFNVERDPGCKENVIADHPNVAEKLKARLLEWMAGDSIFDDSPRPARTAPMTGR